MTNQSIPQWKVWLSYLWNQQLTTTKSPFNPYLEVALSRGRLQLSTDRVVYSFEDLYRNFYAAFHELNIKTQSLEEVLMLGYGLGSVAVMLENHFGQNVKQYTAVEIDDVVIDLAKQFLPEKILLKTKFNCEDASDFVERQGNTTPSPQYDLIALDIFIDDVTPHKFRHPDFLRNIATLLNKEGYLLYNTLTSDGIAQKTADRFQKEVFEVIFPTCKVINVTGNRILVYQNNDN